MKNQTVQTIELKEIQFVEVNGEFEQVFGDAKKYPAFLTNAAVKKGFDMGIIESSLFEDLLKLKGLESLVSSDKEEDATKLLGAFDEQKLIAVIYLGVLGANKNLNMSFDEFLELYHYELPETLQIYANLIAGMVSKSNNFATALQKQAKKNKKKQRHQKHRN